MKIILLKDVPKVGRKFDIKQVADGFATNSLIPRGLAKVATASAVASIEAEKTRDMAEHKIQEELLAKNLETLKGLTLTLSEKANEKGHLFAGVTREMICAEIFKETRLNLDPNFIKLDKPIKEVGEHTVTISAMNKKAEIKLVVESLEN